MGNRDKGLSIWPIVVTLLAIFSLIVLEYDPTGIGFGASSNLDRINTFATKKGPTNSSSNITKVVANTSCSTAKTCSDWGECISGQQTRQCTTTNGCNGSSVQKTESIGCAINCTADWSCSDWEDCSGGKRSRVCTDANSCGTESGKPYQSESCVSVPGSCIESWSCSKWGTCMEGKEARSCRDINNCNTTINKPVESRDCSLKSHQCYETWSCSKWGICEAGIQTRSCEETSGCNTSINIPSLSRPCNISVPQFTESNKTIAEECTELWSCGEWGNCQQGLRERSCIQSSSCQTQLHKPIESEACAPCILTRAYWSIIEAKNHEFVTLNLEAVNCNGMEAAFNVLETDFIFRKNVSSISTVINDGRATVRWKTEWEDDNPLPIFTDDPEFIFKVSVNPEITSENVLQVLNVEAQDVGGWHMAGANPQRTSWVPETLPDSISTLWVKPIYPYVPQKAQVIGAEGKVFVSTSKGLYAFDANTGADVWQYATALPLGHSPTYSDGVLYVGGMDKKIHAVRASNGQGIWTFTAQGGFDTNPIVANGMVYAGSRDGAFYAVNAATGVQFWKYQTGNQILQSAAYQAENDNIASTSQGSLYFVSNDGYGYALNAQNGALIWQSDADPTTPVKDKFPSQGFYSWWPVIYGNDVIFTKTGFYPLNGAEAAWFFGTTPNTAKFVGTVGYETQPGYWPVGEKILDIRTNPNGNTFPDYLEVQEAGDSRPQHGPFRKNAFFIDRATGLERQFDLDSDGKTDGAPISWVGDGGTHPPPVVSGQNNVLYFNSVIRARGTSFNTVSIFGWKVGTPFVSVTSDDIRSSDEPMGVTGAGDKLYYNHCCDREIHGLNIARPNTDTAGDPGREWTYISGGGLAFFSWPLSMSGLPNTQSNYYYKEAVKYFWDPQPNLDPPCCPAVFWNENDKVGPSVYNGKLYVVLGNSLVALGAGGAGTTAPLLSSAPSVTAPDPPPIFSEAQIRQKLSQEVTEIIDAGHLKPSYLHSGGITGGSFYRYNDQYLNQYWHNPAETQVILLRALPYLDSTQQARLRTYLQTEFNTYNPSTYAHVGFADGTQRDPWPYPPAETVLRLFNLPQPKQTSSGGFNGWGFPPSNVYAVWKYAQAGLGTPSTLFTQWGTRLKAPIIQNGNHLNDTYLTDYPHVANAYIAAYKGYVELAKLAGQSSTVWQPYQNELDRLLDLRKRTLSTFPNWQNSAAASYRSYYRSIITYYNFAYMTPELATYLRTNARSPNDPACNLNDRFMTNCKDILSILQKYQDIAPYWMVAHNGETQGESAIQPYQPTHAMFQALARVKGASREELLKYLDTPIVPVGDLYYIDNLVAVLEAGSSGPVTNIAPSVFAGNDQIVTLPSVATLDASVNDDGLPSSTLTYSWTKISGPGTANFANANNVDTTATFSSAGMYVLRLSSSDGALSSSDDITITVNTAAVATCTFTAASFSRTSATEGTVAIFSVIGNNCNGRVINFTLMEDDTLDPDDLIVINPRQATFNGNTANLSWTTAWQCDGLSSGICNEGNPEYFFIAKLSTNGSVQLQSSNVLAVSATNSVQTASVTPNGGTFTGSQLVTLSTTTSSARIYYTTDGTDPTNISRLYSAPFTITTATTVKARAIRQGYSPSQISSASFALAGVGPAISNIRNNLQNYPSSQVPKFEKFEASFDVSTAAQNLFFPYDTNPPNGVQPGIGVTVNAHFIDSDGTEYLQPAFYYQLFDDQVKTGNKEWFYPTNDYDWKVRFAPHKTGRWTYYFTVQDASGSMQSQNMQFDVTSSQSHGFIKVSQDPRYFEYDDGTYFPALGFNYQLDNVNPRLGNINDFQTMKQNGIELARVWISAFSIYGEPWSKWGSPNRFHGTQEQRMGILAPNNLQFSQNYPSFIAPTPPSGSDYYMWLEYNLARSGSDYPRMTACRYLSQVPVKQNTNYRVRVRYKDIGIEGTPGQQYGFTVKTDTGFYSNATRCNEPSAGIVIAATYDTSDVLLDGENPGWSILQGTFSSGSTDFLTGLYLSFNNVRDTTGDGFAGHVFIDKVWLEEASCPVGSGCPNLISKPWMDMHMYINQRDAYSFDKVLDLASQNDIYLKAVMNEKNDRIFQTIDYSGNIVSTQSVENYHGNLRTVTKVRWLQQSWWRYMQARWGYSKNIHSWELLNEGSTGSLNHLAQADEFGKYMKCRVFEKGSAIVNDNILGNICRYDHPNSHLVSTSFSNGAFPWRFWNNRDRLYADMDYADQHLYATEGTTNSSLFNDSALFSNWLSTANNFNASTRKPFIRGEAGWSFTGTDIFTNNQDNGQWFHDYIWAGVNHGGLMEHFFATGSFKRQIYYIDNGGVVRHDHRDVYKPYYDFIKNIPLNNGRYIVADATVSDTRITAWGQKDSTANKAHLWIRNKRHTWRNVVNSVTISPVSASITLRGFTPSTAIRIEWWNTYTGVAVSTQTINSDASGNLVLQVTNLADDMAVKVGNYDSSGPPPVDIIPPTRSSGQPTGALAAGTTQTTLSLITDESATCKYSTTANTAYASMTGTFTTTGSTSHSRSVTGLINGQAYNYYVRCSDTTGNPNANDYAITFSVQSLTCTDTDEDGYSVSGGSCGAIDCNDNNANIYPGRTESCNNVDDDCDTSVDEALSRLCSLNYQGICGAGGQTCSVGSWSACPTPIAEICGNGLDEDCNGSDPVCPCVLTGAAWSAPAVAEGQAVTLTVTASNCNGQQVAFSIWENDTAFQRDPVSINPPNSAINGNIAASSWTAEWQTDCLGLCNPPEYYFVTTLVSNPSMSIFSRQMTVSPTDNIPPFISSGQPTGTLAAGTAQITLRLQTNEAATCRYSALSGTSYASMINTFTTTGGTSHSKDITGLQDGQSYIYNVRCADNRNNFNTNDYSISFLIAQPLICTDNDNDSYSAEGGLCGQIDCNDNDDRIYPRATETCNNVDEDCNSLVDDSLVRQCSISFRGICGIGSETCTVGRWNGCPVPLAEICGNGLDENCDDADQICPNAPALSPIMTNYISSTSVIVKWSTNLPATSKIEYGAKQDDRNINYDRFKENGTLKTSHIMLIDSLVPGTVYNFRASSKASNLTSYSRNMIFATINRTAMLATTFEQRTPVSVNGPPVVIRRQIIPYANGPANYTFTNASWFGAYSVRLITAGRNISVAPGQRLELNLSHDAYIEFRSSPPVKVLLSETQNRSVYTKLIEIRTPNHFTNVEASETINTNYSSWKLWHIEDGAKTDVTALYNLRIVGHTITFSSFNTSNVTFEINGFNGCTENWQCSAWTTCSNGFQARTCTDSNSCGTAHGKPSESQSCTTQAAPSNSSDSGGGSGGGGAGGPGSWFDGCTEEWECGEWEPASCTEEGGMQTRTCNDKKGCRTPKIETQGCGEARQEDSGMFKGLGDNFAGCGNGVIEVGETSENCCADIGCAVGYECTLNSCFKETTSKKIRYSAFSLLLLACLVGLFIFFSAKTAKKLMKIKNIRSRADFEKNVEKLEQYLMAEEQKGMSEKELITLLEQNGWDDIYINEAVKKLRNKKL